MLNAELLGTIEKFFSIALNIVLGWVIYKLYLSQSKLTSDRFHSIEKDRELELKRQEVMLKLSENIEAGTASTNTLIKEVQELRTELIKSKI